MLVRKPFTAVNRKLSTLAGFGALAAVYFGCGKFGLTLAHLYSSISPIWPATGVALAAMLMFGKRAWPAIFVGALLVNLTAVPAAPFWPKLFQAVGIATGNTLEALAGAWLANRFANGINAFERVGSIFRYTLLTGGLATALSATIGTLSLWLCGLLAGSHFAHAWLTWWLGDMAGAVTVAPLIVIWATHQEPPPHWRRLPEFIGLIILLFCALQLTFSDSFLFWKTNRSLALPLIPFLIWAGLRFEARGAISVVFLMACFAAIGTLHGFGPFAQKDQNTSLLLLQNFMCVSSVAGLVLAAATSERNSAETALRETNDRLQLALAASHTGTWTRELMGSRRGQWSAQVETLFGLNSGEFDGSEEMFYSLVHPEDRARVRQAIVDTINAREEEVEVEYRFLRRGGTVGWMLSRGRILYDENSKPLQIVGVDIDLTSRRETEMALVKSEERFRRLIATANEGIWEVDTNARTMHVNPRMKEILGYTSQEFLSCSVFELVHPDDVTRVKAAWPTPMDGQSENSEWRLRRKNGDYVWVAASTSTLRDETGMAIGMLAMITDITERKHAEAQFRQLNADLEQRVQQRTAQLEGINKELEAFCYSVSHDLRAPLRTIRGFSEVVLEHYGPQLDDRGRDFLRRTSEAGMQMDKLIEDLLKLSRVARGEIQSREVNLSDIAQIIADELKRGEPRRDVEIVIAPNLAAKGDERLLRLVLDNLLRNAWKFTGKHARARIEFGRTTDNTPAFFVRDDGAGFDMAFASKLFGVFQRLHNPSEFPGSGVGLAIVQRAINRHGGRVWADGKVEGGATFYFTVPEF